MEIYNIKSPQDILQYLNEHITYGWLDINGEIHINNMKNFRKLYRTSSLDETLQHGIGTCIEQVYLISYLLNRIGIQNEMYCTRIYEGIDFNNEDEEEHMHCFVLYYLNDKVYHLEHPNVEKIGIYEYNSLDEALQTINDFYVKMVDGKSRPITKFYEVKPNLSFKEFNEYINSLDNKKTL